MGIHPHYFLSHIAPEFLCDSCGNVLEDPVKIINRAERSYICKSCGPSDLNENADSGEELEVVEYESADEELTNELNSLSIRCPNRDRGCTAVFTLEMLNAHKQCCAWRPYQCKWNCGTIMALKNLRVHEMQCENAANVAEQLSVKLTQTQVANGFDELSEVCRLPEEHDGEGGDDMCGTDTAQDSESGDISVAIHVTDQSDKLKSTERAGNLASRSSYGVLYKKVHRLEASLVKVGQCIDEIETRHNEDIRKLYDYSFKLMETLKSQAVEDLSQLREEMNKRPRNGDQKRKCKKNCNIV